MPLNEFDIIEQIFKSSSSKTPGVVTGIGDDAAILKMPEGQHLAVSTDTLVAGVHFPENTSPFDIGYKSLAVNLSDMAAMAAEPLYVTLSLTLPDNNEDWLKAFSSGFFEIAGKYNVSLIGGDISHGPLSITIQILGCVQPGKHLTRDNAKEGDIIYVTGTLGISAFALSLMNGELNWDTAIPEMAQTRLNRPEPRVDLALSLRGIASSAIDISDGLAADLEHLVSSSNVAAVIDLDQLPIYDELKNLPTMQRWHHALNVGDDYELCFTVPKIDEQKVIDVGKLYECGVNRIGEITEGKGVTWRTAEGKTLKLESKGYLHF